MRNMHRTRRLPSLLIALMLLPSWAAVSRGTAATGQAGHESGADLISELQAQGPHPSLGGGARSLARLVGNWSIAYSFHRKDGTVKHQTGSYFAAWVMDGRAIQDVWTVDPHDGRTDREIYTTLHYLNPKSGTWYATFIDPEHASVARFTGKVGQDGRIVILTHDLGDKADQTNRWSFIPSSANSLTFRDEQSSGDGKAWRLLEEDQFTREDVHSGAAAPHGEPQPAGIR